jgi:RimJ/RimL family protein N-acetyltransferase
MIRRALSFSFLEHRVRRIDLGVSATNTTAIACYEKLGFKHVGTCPSGITTAAGTIDVYWMTVSRDHRGDSGE